MENLHNLAAPLRSSPPGYDPARSTDARIKAVADMLHALHEVPVDDSSAPDAAELNHENKLVQVRLGIATALFSALRAKHPATASHALRVAMGCSSWSMLLDMPETLRDEIEIAALLHDIGKIGVPDRILLKPSQLTTDEYPLIERHQQTGIEILQGCCASRNILEIVWHSGSWWDGSREPRDLTGSQIPLGSRMIAIVDAFDSMTTDQVYRRALSREHAMAELFAHAGTQFDPDLVRDFCSFMNADQIKLNTVVAYRWLKQLQSTESDGFWQKTDAAVTAGSMSHSTENLFQQKLLEEMQDAVIFIDNALRITLWNRSAEQLTGLSSVSVQHKTWSPSLIHMRDERQKLIADRDCPLVTAMKLGEQIVRRLSVVTRDGNRIEVNGHIVPIYASSGVPLGATLLMHDASTQITLEERVSSLHEKATIDPLTKVSNRAEFDRVLSSKIISHLQRQRPFSLVMCDIDHFKKVNDNFGHQAGDAVLIGFAALLKRHCRPGDLVARYGGEEFALLCGDCDNATTTSRADQIRQELERTVQAALNGKCITASFGVTELQDGDTPETMLRRADRGLYQAKEAGRNTVIQLGAGIRGNAPAAKARGWFSWFRKEPNELLLQRVLATAVPLTIVGQKLRGFIADHNAQVQSLNERRIVLLLDVEATAESRRQSDRKVPFVLDIGLEEMLPGKDPHSKKTLQTLLNVTIRPQRGRDRREGDVKDRAKALLNSLKSYLVAQEMDPDFESLSAEG